MMKKYALVLMMLLGLAAHVRAAGPAEVPEGVVVQANGDDVAAFKRALILASNMHEVLSKARFEIVVYGPSVKLLSAFSDELPLIQKVQAEGIEVLACGRSLATEHMSEGELAPGIRNVPFGAVWIVSREKQGWQYIRP
jgi:intracellular sulfur oxidation DsrE/DsrF family protein